MARNYSVDNESKVEKFSMWQCKSFSLAAALVLTLFTPTLASMINGELVTSYDIYQSAPILFEVLVPISAMLIFQNILKDNLQDRVGWFSESTNKLVGFGIACVLALGITIIVPTLVSLNPELSDPRFESFYIYLAIVVLWMMKRGYNIQKRYYR
jgi:uncharacterized ion transporter superfamily protein YfcC